MANVSTIYDVRVRYTLGDNASRALGNIDRRARGAARATAGVSRALRRVAFVAAGAFGIKKAIDFTIGFNRSLARTKAQLRTIIQLNTGRSFADSTKEAGVLMTGLREDAKKSAGTFQEMVQFSTAIAGPITQVGGSLEDLREVTKGAVVAANAFGERAELAQLDIKQALAGTLGAKDRFARAILGPLRITTKEFNKMTAPKRLKTLKEAFNQKGIKDAAKDFQGSFEGVFSTFKSNLQEFGGKVGSKLFARLTVELQRVNKWFDKNEKKVEQFADKLADGLVKAFKLAKKIFGFIIEHKELLLTLAKVFLVAKAVNAFTGPFAALGGALGGFASKLGIAGAALGAFAIGAQAIANKILRDQEKRIKRETANPLLREQARLLGGSAAGRGQKLQRNTVIGAQQNARAIGLQDDIGAIQASMNSNIVDQAKRQIALAQGKFTAGDKLIAEQTLREAKRVGFLRGDAGSRKVDFHALKGNFGVGDDRGSLIPLIRAQKLAKKRFGKDIGQLDAKEIGQVLEDANERFGDGEVKRLSEFLIGLDRSLDLASRTNAERQSMMLAAEAKRRGVTEAQIIGEAFAKAGQNIVTGIGNQFAPILSFFGIKAGKKASEKGKDPKDRKGQTNIGKMVIQVASDDPDRFALGLEGLFSDLAKNGAQAAQAQRGF